MNKITYMTGLLTFYLKGEIAVEQNFLKLKIPNTILSLIPLGAKKDNVPVQQIATVASNFKLEFKSFLVGILEALIGLALIEDSVLIGLILLIIGISTAITAFKTELAVDTTAGKKYNIGFFVFEKKKAEEAERMISQIISNRLNDTNTRQVTEAQTNTVVDAIKGLK